MDGTALTESRVHELVAEVPVVEVTLLEDRALVVRRGLVELPPGRSRLRIDGVAPVLVDKTLAAALTLPRDAKSQAQLPEDLRVRSASVARRRITRDADRPTNFVELRERRRAKQAELEQLAARERAPMPVDQSPDRVDAGDLDHPDRPLGQFEAQVVTRDRLIGELEPLPITSTDGQHFAKAQRDRASGVRPGANDDAQRPAKARPSSPVAGSRFMHELCST